MAATIESYARDIQRGVKADRDDDDWQLTLSLQPLFALSAWPTQGPQATRRWLNYPDSATEQAVETNEPLAIRRQTILTKPLLAIIAENFANSPKTRTDGLLAGRPPPLRKSRPADSGKTPRTEDRSLDSGDSTVPSAGGQPPTMDHHDEYDQDRRAAAA